MGARSSFNIQYALSKRKKSPGSARYHTRRRMLKLPQARDNRSLAGLCKSNNDAKRQFR